MKLPNRKHPIHSPSLSNTHDIIFITVCTNKRIPILANDPSHLTLLNLWRDSSQWLVGRYVLMPDHVHLFTVRAHHGTVSLKSWIGWWKRHFSVALKMGSGTWQTDFWDTRMRTPEHFSSKWLYVRDNPVREGLVACYSDWKYQGEIHNLRF